MDGLTEAPMILELLNEHYKEFKTKLHTSLRDEGLVNISSTNTDEAENQNKDKYVNFFKEKFKLQDSHRVQVIPLKNSKLISIYLIPKANINNYAKGLIFNFSYLHNAPSIDSIKDKLKTNLDNFDELKALFKFRECNNLHKIIKINMVVSNLQLPITNYSSIESNDQFGGIFANDLDYYKNFYPQITTLNSLTQTFSNPNFVPRPNPFPQFMYSPTLNNQQYPSSSLIPIEPLKRTKSSP